MRAGPWANANSIHNLLSEFLGTAVVELAVVVVGRDAAVAAAVVVVGGRCWGAWTAGGLSVAGTPTVMSLPWEMVGPWGGWRPS